MSTYPTRCSCSEERGQLSIPVARTLLETEPPSWNLTRWLYLQDARGSFYAGTQPRYLAALERLLAIEALALSPALDEASDVIAVALSADKVDAFVYEEARVQ